MKKLIVPNLCRNSSLLLVVLITQLVVSVVWLVSVEQMDLSKLAVWSLYGQWVVLFDCFLLCLLRNFISRQSFSAGVLVIITVSLLSVMAVEVVGQAAVNSFQTVFIDWGRVSRLALASVIVCLLVIRFFMLLDTLDSRSKAEAESRILALQSRIQPHFLFNSLNTISELTVTAPEQAEKAIGSLSMLFRASLENNRKHHSLESEISLCKRYIELERWRLQKRLTVKWNLQLGDASAWEVPKLILQPLVENAIVHGVQNDGSISIKLDVRETAQDISLLIENDKGSKTIDVSGNGIALDNIRERLFVLYDDQQTLRVKQTELRYSVIIRFPKRPSKMRALS